MLIPATVKNRCEFLFLLREPIPFSPFLSLVFGTGSAPSLPQRERAGMEDQIQKVFYLFRLPVSVFRPRLRERGLISPPHFFNRTQNDVTTTSFCSTCQFKKAYTYYWRYNKVLICYARGGEREDNCHNCVTSFMNSPQD